MVKPRCLSERGWGGGSRRREGGRGGVLSYVKQACGCPLLCGVRTLFSGQFEHASVASLALAPPNALYRATTKAGVCCSVPRCPPPPPLLYSKLRFPTLPSRSFTHLHAHRQPVQPTLGPWPPCHSNGARQTSILN